MAGLCRWEGGGGGAFLIRLGAEVLTAPKRFPLCQCILNIALSPGFTLYLHVLPAAQAAAQLAPLAPEAFFAPGGAAGCTSPFITRDQVRSHEAALKAELLRWACECGEEGRAAAGAALGTIAATCYQEAPEHSARLQVCAMAALCGCRKALTEAAAECSSPLAAYSIAAHAHAHEQLHPLPWPAPSCLQDGQALVGLLLDLLAQDLLPAIVFSFERSACHYLAEAVVQYLEVGGCMQGCLAGRCLPVSLHACGCVCLLGFLPAGGMLACRAAGVAAGIGCLLLTHCAAALPPICAAPLAAGLRGRR